MSSVLAPEHRAPYLGPAGPWTRRNAAASALLAAGSLGGLLVAWVGASDQTRLEDELHWLVLGILALAVGGLAGAVWLGRGLRSIRSERRALRRRLRAMEVGAPTGTAATTTVWVMAAGMTRRHHPDCEYVRGKSVREVPAESAPPCVVCAG